MARRYDDDEADRISVPIVLALIPILGILAFVAYRWVQANGEATAEAERVATLSEVDDGAAADDLDLAGGGDLGPEPDRDIDTTASLAEPESELAPVLPDEALAPEPEPVPEPIPEPIQAPSEPRTASVTVYFELMKASLTPEASDLLAAQMSDLAGSDIISIQIDGYTDTAGVASYNAPLSRRRAEAVGSALVSLGASSSSVSTEGHGETALAVQTPDGVREPGNRRAVATITVQ